MTHGTQAAAQSEGTAWLLLSFYCAGFVLVGGGFVLYTSGADPRLARELAAGSPLSQLLLGLFYTGSTLLLIGSRDARRVFKFVWPLLLLPALALLSTLWSPDPALTLRRAIAFAGTVLFGLSLGSAFRFRDALALVSFSMALVLGISFALAFFDPIRAIHQPDDAIQAVHAGFWRGIFAHRNTLGFWAGASVIVIALGGREAFARVWLWLSALALALVCLFASGSSAGIAILVLGAAFFSVVVVSLRQPVQVQGALMLFWSLVVLLLYVAFEPIAQFSLSLLGRESDLSGRTQLWSYIVDLVRSSDKPLGLGYFVGTLVIDQRLSAATQMRNVNAHNGFLEAYIYFGWIGLILSIGVAFWLMRVTAMLARQAMGLVGHLAAIPAVFVFIAVVHNLVESTIVSPNNLNNVLLATAAAMAARASLSGRG